MSCDPLGARRATISLIRGALEERKMLDEGSLPEDLPGPDRARAMSLARETLRWLGALDNVLGAFVKRPPPNRARAILRLGAAELLAMDGAAHGVVHACVSLAKAHRKTEAQAGMINAVLRRVAEEGPKLWAKADLARAASPEWLWKQLRADWGKTGARAIAEAHLRGAPLDLTVKRDAADWAARLGGEVAPTGSVRLAKPGRITGLDGYDAGAWWAQDAAAAVPARLAGPGEGRKALDLCAAPGGKTMQLAAAGWSVMAVDVDAARLARIGENLERTSLAAALVEADALAWRFPEPFDLVLLDAPCTATGTIRRHPELPHIRNGAGLRAAAETQDRLLDVAFAHVAPGGTLIFCTCSLAKAEGEARASAFLERTPDAARDPIRAEEIGDAELLTPRGDFRARPDHWPDIGGLDGFFAARFVKSAASASVT